jgi:hypothetical protein
VARLYAHDESFGGCCQVIRYHFRLGFHISPAPYSFDLEIVRAKDRLLSRHASSSIRTIFALDPSHVRQPSFRRLDRGDQDFRVTFQASIVPIRAIPPLQRGKRNSDAQGCHLPILSMKPMASLPPTLIFISRHPISSDHQPD